MPKFRCPKCNQKLAWPDDRIGKRYCCPRCKEIGVVPAVGLPSESPTAPPPAPQPPVAAAPGPVPQPPPPPPAIPTTAAAPPAPPPATAITAAVPPAPEVIDVELIDVTPAPAPAPLPAPPPAPSSPPPAAPIIAAAPLPPPPAPPSAPPAADDPARTRLTAPPIEPPPTPPDDKTQRATSPPEGSFGTADTARLAAIPGPQAPKRRRRLLVAGVLVAGIVVLIIAAAATGGFGLIMPRRPSLEQKLNELRSAAMRLKAEGKTEDAYRRYEELLTLAATANIDKPELRDLVAQAQKEKDLLYADLMKAKGYVLHNGNWVTKEQLEIERLKAELEALKNRPGRLRVAVSLRGERFPMQWPDADALVVLAPKEPSVKLRALSALLDRGRLTENRRALAGVGAYAVFTARDGRAAIDSVKPGSYALIIVSRFPWDDPADARAIRSRLARYFADTSGLTQQVHIADIDVPPGEQKEVAHEFTVRRRR